VFALLFLRSANVMMRSADAQPCVPGATTRDGMRPDAVRASIFVSRRAISGGTVSCAASLISIHGVPGVSFSANRVSVAVISPPRDALSTNR